MPAALLPMSTLAGLVVTRWQGMQTALAEAHAASDIRWADPGIPFLQLTDLDLELANGQVFKIWSRVEDGTGRHGLFLQALDGSLRILERNESLLVQLNGTRPLDH